LKVNFLEANNGDCILISYEYDGSTKNILVDSGVSKTYEYKIGRLKKEGRLKKVIFDLQEKNQYIDLLIITHVDDDHIGGILKYFASNDYDSNLIKKVWFNSGRLINEYFQENLENQNEQELNEFDTTNTSINQGVTFESKIDSTWDRRLIKSDIEEINEQGIKFKILSPNDEKLKKLLTKWEKEAASSLTSLGTDYDKTIEYLTESDEFKEDQSIHNGSSIAFILEILDKKMLFLGDAHPSTIIEKLIEDGISENNKLKLDFVKLSHHASKANTSYELLKLIDCKKFIVLTDGSFHGLPNKVTFSRIFNINDDSELYFNYPHLIDEVFSNKEKTNYILKDAKDLII
jgi:beta-lactamase superfamily II metal-dependent hydrolase